MVIWEQEDEKILDYFTLALSSDYAKIDENELSK